MGNKPYSLKGLSKHPLHAVWIDMKRRCNDSKRPAFKNYGGRGISVCQEWSEDFIVFYNWGLSAGYQAGLQIDRINNDWNYSPDNCKWSTPLENSLNKRSNIRFTYQGRTLVLSEWARYLGVPYSTLYFRLHKYKMPVEIAFDTTLIKVHEISQKFGGSEEKYEDIILVQPLKEFVSEIEKYYVLDVLSAFKFSYTKTAKALGVNRKTIYNKIGMKENIYGEKTP